MLFRIKPNRALAIFTTLASCFFLGILFQNRLYAGRYLLQGYLLAPFTSTTILGSLPSRICPHTPPNAFNASTFPDPNLQPSLFAASFDLPNLIPPSGAPELVPRIIHQVRLGTLEMRPQWTAARASCKELMPKGDGEGDWSYVLWTDESGDEFVETYYPEVFATYRGYSQEIQRSNVLRYLVLHHFGGIYLDLDLLCRKPLDAFLTVPFLTPPANPSGVNNAFIVAEPRHEFFTDLISYIVDFDMPWVGPYTTNMFSTGCHFFSSLHLASPYRSRLYVLPQEYKLNGKVDTPVLSHFGSSVWHKGDARLILALGRGVEFMKRASEGKTKWVYFGLFGGVGHAVWAKVFGGKRRGEDIEVEEGLMKNTKA